jgi:hypothetical protein
MALLVCSVIRVDASPCPGPASVAMFAENLSADSAVTLHVEGQLVDAGATCDGTGATTYATTLDCAGAAAGRPRKVRPALRKARMALRAFIEMVHQSSRVGGSLERQLTDTAQAAIAMARPGA